MIQIDDFQVVGLIFMPHLIDYWTHKQDPLPLPLIVSRFWLHLPPFGPIKDIMQESSNREDDQREELDPKIEEYNEADDVYQSNTSKAEKNDELETEVNLEHELLDALDELSNERKKKKIMMDQL